MTAMKPEDVPEELVRAAWNGWCAGQQDGMHAEGMRRALAAVIPLIQAQEREACAVEADCGCLNRDAVLSANTKADRWRACPRDPCGAETAAAIRARKP